MFVVEYPTAVILLLESTLAFLPLLARRKRVTRSRAQRINCNGSFVLVILAPIHQDFADAQTLFHIRDDKIAMIVLQHSRKRMGEWLGDVVTRGCVERNIKLQSFGTGSFWKALQPKMIKNRA